jgi:hypothetical protein
MDNNPLSNVREVMRLIPGSDQRFQCTVDLTLNGVTETVGYIADKDDVAETGQWVYAQIINGEAGEIAEYVPPAPPSNEQLAEMARAMRGHLLQRLDVFVSNPLRWSTLSEDMQAEASGYRQALLDVPQQEGFPSTILWPEAPAYLGIQLPG